MQECEITHVRDHTPVLVSPTSRIILERQLRVEYMMNFDAIATYK